MTKPVITTNPALCHDCYSCVRQCTVKAIRVIDGQAHVIPELCIVCGTCIRVCPQKAKDVQSSRQELVEALQEKRTIVASVAPSIPAYFDIVGFSQVEDTLKALGFHAVEETAIGAEIVARAHRTYVEKSRNRWPVITSSCPVIVNLIEQYYPDLIPNLAPIVSPMIAHGLLMARKYGPDASVVFIGPCIAKKMEACDESVPQAIDIVATFRGLETLLTEFDIPWQNLDERASTEATGKARLFPVEGGLIGTAGMNTDILDRSMVVASGLDACRNMLDDIRSGNLNASIAELLACKGGCVGGPVMENIPGGIYFARQKIIDFQGRHQPELAISPDEWPDLHREYRDRRSPVPDFSEEEIQSVLHQINKYTPDDEWNCGACGYSSCREKASATLRGMAEATMCIPYMRQRSESLRQMVMDVTPSAILIIDDKLVVQDMSPSAERLFKCSIADVKGKHLSSLISVLNDFIHVRDTGQPVIGRVRRLNDNLVAEQSIVRVEGHHLTMGILRDVTERERERESFRVLREQTLNSAREVLSRQMRVAHEIAHLLGETTAESKNIVSHLAQLLKEDDDE